MKMERKNWKRAMVFILLIVIVLFLLYNVRAFFRGAEVREKSLAACEGLNFGDECEFFLDEEVIGGVCEENPHGELVCRPPQAPEGFFRRR
ncbi:MAG: hypothetical protein KKD18_01865 [Nanoarchaeota archaeon]|nr:hypothetical protein [Nanoarchaeota archaeon]